MQEISIEDVKQRIERALPGATVEVTTFSGADHFQASVEATQFQGKTLVEQHRMVDVVKTCLDVGVEHPPPTLIGRPTDSFEGLVSRTSRTKPETHRAEVHF